MNEQDIVYKVTKHLMYRDISSDVEKHYIHFIQSGRMLCVTKDI